MMMWHDDDVDSVHVKRLGSSRDQLLKIVRFVVVTLDYLFLLFFPEVVQLA